MILARGRVRLHFVPRRGNRPRNKTLIVMHDQPLDLHLLARMKEGRKVLKKYLVLIAQKNSSPTRRNVNSVFDRQLLFVSLSATSLMRLSIHIFSLCKFIAFKRSSSSIVRIVGSLHDHKESSHTCPPSTCLTYMSPLDCPPVRRCYDNFHLQPKARYGHVTGHEALSLL